MNIAALVTAPTTSIILAITTPLPSPLTIASLTPGKLTASYPVHSPGANTQCLYHLRRGEIPFVMKTTTMDLHTHPSTSTSPSSDTLYDPIRYFFDSLSTNKQTDPSTPLALSDVQLLWLHDLFRSIAVPALDILDKRLVTRLVCESIEKKDIFQVGESICILNSHFCTCKSYLYNALPSRNTIFCKHLLAATLADRLHNDILLTKTLSKQDYQELLWSAFL